MIDLAGLEMPCMFLPNVKTFVSSYFVVVSKKKGLLAPVLAATCCSHDVSPNTTEPEPKGFYPTHAPHRCHMGVSTVACGLVVRG